MDAITRPSPVPDKYSQPYWEAARARRLVAQHCEDCGRFQYPPDALCRHCQSSRLGFSGVNGRGVVYTFATYTRSFSRGFDAPYVLALIDLEDHAEVRMLTNIVEAAPRQLRVGLLVEVVFEDRGEWRLPQFRPVRAAS